MRPAGSPRIRRRRGGRFPLFRAALLAALLLALAGVCPSSSNAEAPAWGDLLVLDRAWPVQSDSGAAVVASFTRASVSPVAFLPRYERLSGIAWASPKTLYVGDGPRLRKFDPYLPMPGNVETIRHDYFDSIVALERDSSGNLYLLDRESDPLSEGYSGAVLLFRPETRAVSIVASSRLFGSPSDFAAGPDGRLYVLDPTGRMAGTAPSTGALFAVDPGMHTVEALLSLSFMTRPAAVAVRDPQTLLLLDGEASVPGGAPNGGAIYVVSLPSLAIEDTLAVPAFREPVDLVMISPSEAAVLDANADMNGAVAGKGALLRIDLDAEAAVDTLSSTLFRSLASLARYDGPDMDASRFVLEGAESGEAAAGASLRFTAALVNRAPMPTGPLSVSVELDSLLCLFTNAEAESGELLFDADGPVLTWRGELGPGDSTHFAMDVRVPVQFAAGRITEVVIQIDGEGISRVQTIDLQTVANISAGQVFYLDAGATSSPRIFYLGAGGYEPVTWLSDSNMMPRMIDLTFGPDGTVYVLDNQVNRPRVVAVNPVDRSKRIVHEGAPLTIPTAICLGHDGSLLITDPKAYYPETIPPVIYRLDPQSGDISVFFTTTNLSWLNDPMDICPDIKGHYMVADMVSNPGNDRWGRVVELDGAGHWLRKFDRVGLALDDPMSVVVDDDGTIFVTDSTSGAQPPPGVYKITRNPIDYVRIASGAIDTLLVCPAGIERLEAGRFALCDWSSNPYYPGHGGLLRLNRLSGGWEVKSLSFHYSLWHPRRAAIFRPPELQCDLLQMGDGQTPPAPGDTVQVKAVVRNRCPMPALDTGAILTHSDQVKPVGWRATRGLLRPDSEGRVHWTVDLAFQKAETLWVDLEVDSLAPTHSVIDAAIQLLGGANSPSLAVSDTIMGPLGADQVLVLDARADPFHRGHRGAIFLYDAENLKLIPYRSREEFRQPSDMCMLDENRALILESKANASFGPDTGALWEYDLEEDRLNILAGGPPFVSPQRVLVLPNGDCLILDASVVGAGFARGAVFRIPAGQQELQVLAQPSSFRMPIDMTLQGDSILWVADTRANPKNLSVQNTGAIFGLDVQTGAVVDTIADESLQNPQGVMWVEGRGLFFVDPRYRVGPNTAIRVANPETDQISNFLTSLFLTTPSRLTLGKKNQFFVVDSLASPVADTLRGSIFRGGLVSGVLERFVQHPEVKQLQALVRIPSVEIELRSWSEQEDASGFARQPGDTLHCRIVAENPGRLPDPATSLEVRLPDNLRLLTSSLHVSDGKIASSPQTISWEGSIQPGDSAWIDYSAIIPPRLPGMTPWIEQRAYLTCARAESDSALMRHYISNATGDGEILVADGRADILHHSRAQGAVFRIEGPTREPVPVVASADLRQLMAVELLPGSTTEMLLLDSDADPAGIGKRGCLLRASTRTGEVSLLFQDSTFVDPIGITVLDSVTCFLLDRLADPFDLVPGPTGGPGAVYRIDVRTGAGEPIASDTRFSSPVDLVPDPTTGRIFLIDEDAGGGGSGQGGVFEIHPDSGEVTEIWTGEPFQSPRCGTIGDDGALLVMDRRQIGAAVLRLADGPSTSIVASCTSASDPRDMVVDYASRIVFSDATANPGGFPGPTGSILRIDPELERCQLYRGGSPFVQPRGISVRYEGTPVSLIRILLSETAGGVQLCWEAPRIFGGALFYVYRRSPEEAGSEFALLNPESPIEGDGESCFLDHDILPGALYEYQLLALREDGSQTFPPVSLRVSSSSVAFSLGAPGPNPFRPGSAAQGLAIRFQMPSAQRELRLSVFDVAGRLVRNLLQGPIRAGSHAVYWNGRDDHDAPAGSGIYFVRLDAGPYRASRRIVLLR